MRLLFDDNPRLVLRTIESERGVHHSTVKHLFRKELKRFPYKLQMSTKLTEYHKTERK